MTIRCCYQRLSGKGNGIGNCSDTTLLIERLLELRSCLKPSIDANMAPKRVPTLNTSKTMKWKYLREAARTKRFCVGMPSSLENNVSRDAKLVAQECRILCIDKGWTRFLTSFIYGCGCDILVWNGFGTKECCYESSSQGRTRKTFINVLSVSPLFIFVFKRYQTLIMDWFGVHIYSNKLQAPTNICEQDTCLFNFRELEKSRFFLLRSLTSKPI